MIDGLIDFSPGEIWIENNGNLVFLGFEISKLWTLISNTSLEHL